MAYLTELPTTAQWMTRKLLLGSMPTITSTMVKMFRLQWILEGRLVHHASLLTAAGSSDYTQ